MGTDSTGENSGKSIPLSHGLMIDVVDRTYHFIHNCSMRIPEVKFC